MSDNAQDEAGTPRDYGLAHDQWRPQQREMVKRLVGLTPEKVLLLEAPTGSGKTALAGAVSSRFSTTALCRAKMLQRDNYEQGYGFDALFGRGNYPCALNVGLRASECEYADEGMHKCPQARNCAYLWCKEKVKSSRKRSLNYAYWLVSKWPREQITDYVFLDEAHLLSDIVLDFAGTTITEKERGDWGLPPFPTIVTGSMVFCSDPVGMALKWLTAARQILAGEYAQLSSTVRLTHDEGTIRRLRRCEQIGTKVRATIDALQQGPQDWYILSGPKAREYMGNPQPAFVCKPLTARFHAPRYFLDGHITVAMSATIGNPATFAAELGIPDYDSAVMASNWPAAARPVYVLKGAPALGMAAKRQGEVAYEQQADLIVKALKEHTPSDWSGVIHCTSKADSRALAGRLARRGLGERVWLPPDGGTDEQMKAWQTHRSRVGNALAVTYSWHEGVNLTRERICIIAKVPFPSLGDRYERERMDYDGKFYLQRTAWQLEQACGRTRRGEEDDYDTPERRNGFVAIVDANWKRCQRYLSAAFLESVVEL